MSRIPSNRRNYLNPDYQNQRHQSQPPRSQSRISQDLQHAQYHSNYQQRKKAQSNPFQSDSGVHIHSNQNQSQYNEFDDFNEFDEFEGASSDPFEQQLESNALAEAQDEKEREKRGVRNRKIGTIALIIACVYIIFLIYGVFCTSFMYDKSGSIHPQVLTVSQIKDKKTFDGVMIYYNDCKLMYKEILKADYNASLTVGDNAEYTQAEVSKQYSDLLKTSKTINAEKLASRLHAAADDSRFGAYTPVLGAMYQWANNYVPQYLTDAAKYLTGQNTSELSNTVISLQTVLNDKFTAFTQTMAGYAEGKAGVDISELQWNPTTYYKQLQEGKVGSKD